MSRILMCCLALLAGQALADPVRETVSYEIEGRKFDSVLVYDGALGTRRPGLVMVPNWLGITDEAIARAVEIAGDRYVILVADLYGADLRPADFQEAGQASGAVLGDRDLTRARALRAVQALHEAGGAVLRPGPVGAFGFCFGGTVALELARAGADVAGVVSLHGDPKPVQAAQPDSVKASVLVLHGAADGFVPDGNLRAFEQEMDTAGADWTLVSFSGAQHCFAEPGADNQPPGCVYDARAADRAYRMLHDFFAERLARR